LAYVPALVIEFDMDGAYFREFHAEWVHALGRGWRVDRRMIPLAGAAGAGLAGAGWAFRATPLLAGGAVLLFAAGHELGKRWRRRRSWLRHCRSLPWYEQRMRLLLVDGELVQEHDLAGDPRYRRTGSIVPTPRGYLVRYEAAEPLDISEPAVSVAAASVYVPHRAIQPPLTREAFASRVTALKRLHR
jgi:hypothetical protein